MLVIKLYFCEPVPVSDDKMEEETKRHFTFTPHP